MFRKVSAEWEAQHYPLDPLEDVPAEPLPVVPLNRCEFDKKNLALRLASEFFGMPREFVVQGVYNSVRFIPVPEGHRLFDPDQWDGEQQVYIPAPGEKCGWVRSLVIYHAW